MGEVFLSEVDEERLKQEAVNRVLLAFLAQYAASSSDPDATLAAVRTVAINAALGGLHSDNPETNDYSRRRVASLVDVFIDQIKFEWS